jgi:phosphotransferase family enzyme
VRERSRTAPRADADVFALDTRRVLRRYRTRDVPDREVAIMRFARERGYPVPEVHDVRGRDLILERIDGVEMAADLMRRPWRVRHHARTLAELHRRLHEIAPPAWLRGEGARIAHLDLHPRNVIVGPGGPFVIDWANARRDDAALDVALSAIVTAGAPLRPPLTWLRDLFVREFLGRFAPDEWRPAWDRAIAYRRADENVGVAERARLTSLRF